MLQQNTPNLDILLVMLHVKAMLALTQKNKQLSAKTKTEHHGLPSLNFNSKARTKKKPEGLHSKNRIRVHTKISD